MFLVVFVRPKTYEIEEKTLAEIVEKVSLFVEIVEKSLACSWKP